MEVLLDANNGSAEKIPPTPEELHAMLGAMRVGQQTQEVVDLWQRYKEDLRAEKRVENPGVTDSSTEGKGKANGKDYKLRILASFLRFFSRSSAIRRLPAEERQLSIYRDEVLSYLPRPYPPAIHHSLLMHRARVDDEVKDTPEIVSLDEVPVEFRDKAQVLEDLEAAWKAAGDEGARDLKSYMLYMEGLAKVGDAMKLGMAWEQLVKDEACRDGYLKEEGQGELVCNHHR